MPRGMPRALAQPAGAASGPAGRRPSRRRRVAGRSARGFGRPGGRFGPGPQATTARTCLSALSAAVRHEMSVLRRQGADPVRKAGSGTALEGRVLPAAAYRRHVPDAAAAGPAVRGPKSAAGRITGRFGPLFALRPRKRFRTDAVLIVDGAPVPTHGHTVAEHTED